MKGYMEPGEFSRGTASIRARGGLMLASNVGVDVEHQQQVSRLYWISAR